MKRNNDNDIKKKQRHPLKKPTTFAILNKYLYLLHRKIAIILHIKELNWCSFIKCAAIFYYLMKYSIYKNRFSIVVIDQNKWKVAFTSYRLYMY